MEVPERRAVGEGGQRVLMGSRHAALCSLLFQRASPRTLLNREQQGERGSGELDRRHAYIKRDEP